MTLNEFIALKQNRLIWEIGYHDEAQQNSLFHVFVRFFDLDRAQNTVL